MTELMTQHRNNTHINTPCRRQSTRMQALQANCSIRAEAGALAMPLAKLNMRSALMLIPHTATAYQRYTKCTQALQTNPSIRAEAAALAVPLAKLVEEGASKLALRASGVSALLACCYIAAASHEADETFKQQKVQNSCTTACS